jgi:hypothetical protein
MYPKVGLVRRREKEKITKDNELTYICVGTRHRKHAKNLNTG